MNTETVQFEITTEQKKAAIAKFMGYEPYKDTGAWIKKGVLKMVLSYDTCLSELMPVVEEIICTTGTGDFEIGFKRCRLNIGVIGHQTSGPIRRKYIQSETESENMIDNIFDCVCQYIELIENQELVNS